MSGVKCQVSNVRCHMSNVMCHVSPVTCHMSLRPTATATDPPTANSPTIHSRLVCKDQQMFCFSCTVITISITFL